MDGSVKINIAKENFTGPFFLGSLPQILARVHAIQFFFALFRHMEILIRMNVKFFKFE